GLLLVEEGWLKESTHVIAKQVRDVISGEPVEPGLPSFRIFFARDLLGRDGSVILSVKEQKAIISGLFEQVEKLFGGSLEEAAVFPPNGDVRITVQDALHKRRSAAT